MDESDDLLAGRVTRMRNPFGDGAMSAASNLVRGDVVVTSLRHRGSEETVFVCPQRSIVIGVENEPGRRDLVNVVDGCRLIRDDGLFRQATFLPNCVMGHHLAANRDEPCQIRHVDTHCA